ncbi:MAG: MOSC domain-containing protein [Salinarimonas sp.]
MSIRITGLYRYPVKGLSPEALPRIRLDKGGHVPGDRLFAIENGDSGFDPQNPQHRAKTHYLMLMRDEALARLETAYDADTNMLSISCDGGLRLRAACGEPDGQDAIAACFRDYLGEAGLRGTPRLLRAPQGYRFTDSPRGFVSIINLASVAAVENFVGAPVDPLRFRGNLHVEGLPAWEEFSLVGKTLTAPSGLQLRVTSPIVRCAATNVDPGTGLRDLSIPQALMRHLGHMDCGVYAEIIAPGTLATGGHLIVEDETGENRLPF